MLRQMLVCTAAIAFLPIAGAGERLALLVGVREYDRAELKSLKYTENDATELADVLRQQGFDRVVLLTQTEGAKRARYLPTARNIRDELQGVLAGLTPSDLVVVAFAGHGVQFRNESDNYFCPMDARLAERETLVSLKSVYASMQKSNAGTKLLLVDACRNDPQSDLSRSLERVKLASVTRPQAMQPPGGVAALFSCSAGQRSYESDDLKHGIFFHHIIEGWKGKAKNSDGSVGWTDLVGFAQRRVRNAVKDEIGALIEQVPEAVGALSGDVVLAGIARNVRPPEPDARPVKKSASELARAKDNSLSLHFTTDNLVCTNAAGKELWTQSTRPLGKPSAATFAPTNDRVCAVGSDAIALYNARSGQMIWSRKIPAISPSKLTFSDDGTRVQFRFIEQVERSEMRMDMVAENGRQVPKQREVKVSVDVEKQWSLNVVTGEID